MVESLVIRPSRVILDTNVCLDLFVFRDPHCTVLLEALRAGHVDAVTAENCRREWEIVLGYSHLPLDPQSRLACAAEYDRLIKCLRPDEVVAHPELRLPACRDPDDQKFVELACGANADYLITKDKALLKLAKRVAKISAVRILTPQNWQLAHAP